MPLMVPLLLLGLLFVFSDRRMPSAGGMSVAAAPSRAVAVSAVRDAPPEMIWISHDWVEAPASADQDRDSRRTTFGIDRIRGTTECTDPGCRACLIDLVYGQEF